MPEKQAWQVEMEVAPASVEKVPEGQAWQVAREVAPVEEEKVPRGQGVEVIEPRGQKDPAGQSMGMPLEQ